MDWREVTAEDLLECLEIEPRVWGDEIVGRARALEVWSKLTRSLVCNSAMVETVGAKRKKVGFGCSVFVTPEFMDCELRRPQWGINGRILASVVCGEPVVRAESSLYESNDALDVVILSCNYRYDAMNTEEIVKAEMMLPAAFAELHIGYRLNRILVETVSARQRQVHESAGVWRVVAEYPECERAWLLLTVKDAVSVSGSLAGPLFDYHEPTLGLRDTEKQLLAEALRGGTDKELAAKLNLSMPTVKKRWASLFNRIVEVRPDLLPEREPRESPESRGPQKRHRVLAYVRAHPEEVRPYRWRRSVA
jgi:DNA-binding CsgD family transcriptional regulator